MGLSGKTTPRLQSQQSLQRMMGSRFKTQTNLDSQSPGQLKTTKNLDVLHDFWNRCPPHDSERNHTRRCIKPSANVAPGTLCRHKTSYLPPNKLMSAAIIGETLCRSYFRQLKSLILHLRHRSQRYCRKVQDGKWTRCRARDEITDWKKKRTMRKISYLCSPEQESTLRGTNCIYSKINTMIYSETQF